MALDIAGYERKIQKAAAATRKTGEVPSASLEAAEKAATKIGKSKEEPQKPDRLSESLRGVGTAAVESFKTQSEAQKQQAEKAASALEMTGSSTLEGLRNIENLQSQVKAQVQSASESWGAAAEKADEYVQASRGRVKEVLDKLDSIQGEFAKERNFAKAHAMQSSVQAVVGSMKSEERNIMETYGKASPEYNQFRAAKLSTLATVQSNIHASYQKLAEDQNQNYLNVVSEAYTKSNMYVGFQEQQHVDMLKYTEGAKAAYGLQAAQLDASLEQMKMTGMENLANWIVETPSFTMDMTPLMTLLADLQTTYETQTAATALTEAQTALTSEQAEKTRKQHAWWS